MSSIDTTSDATPVIFIHYGAASYLPITLAAAQRSNPAKRILFLGDEANQRQIPQSIEFHPFADFDSGEELTEFESVFKIIEGKKHAYTKTGGTHAWLKFVFKRWFLIHNALRKLGIDAFWTFDSDTLLLADLKEREARYSNFDCTEQCLGKCLNGWVGSRALVGEYVRCINTLFVDEAFLESERERVTREPTVAFYEMDAYAEFRKRRGIQSSLLSDPLHGEAFDDALAFSQGCELTAATLPGGRRIKQLWTDGHAVYVKKKATGEYVRLLSCNMSWMPDYLTRRLAGYATPGSVPSLQQDKLRSVSIKEPLLHKALRHLHSWRASLPRCR